MNNKRNKFIWDKILKSYNSQIVGYKIKELKQNIIRYKLSLKILENE